MRETITGLGQFFLDLDATNDVDVFGLTPEAIQKDLNTIFDATLKELERTGFGSASKALGTVVRKGDIRMGTLMYLATRGLVQFVPPKESHHEN
jgi:hypothetical protein